MTRLDQALRWWGNNQNIKFRTVEARRIPRRHLDVLQKAHRLELLNFDESAYRLKKIGVPQ